MIGHTLGAPVMMKLGAYQFSISTAAYQELTRRTEWRWPTQDLYGVLPGVQFTGPGGDTITLNGVIYTEYRGGTGQLDAMRALGATGEPQLLVTGSGAMMGRWVVESVEEKQGTFAAAGMPRKQEFTLQLRKAKDQPAAAIPSPAGVLAKAAAAVAGATDDKLTAPKSALAKFADKAASTIGAAVKTATQAVQAVQAKAAEIGNAVAPVVATAQQAMQTANSLRAAAENMKGSLQNLNSLGNIQSAIYSVQGAASAAANAGAFASGAAKQLGISIDMPSADPALVKTVTDCQAACGRLATTATGIYSEAETLAKSVTSMVRP